MQTDKNQSLSKRLRFAMRGLAHALSTEHSLRFQAATLAVVWVAMSIERPEPLWWAVVLLASTTVLAAELLNTAIEHLADHLHPQTHDRIRIVKDCAAAAVLLAASGAVAVGIALAAHLMKK